MKYQKQEAKKKENKKLFLIILLAGLMTFFMINIVSAVTFCSINSDCPLSQTCDRFTGTCKSISPLDFWSVFVEQTFGNFWYAVFGLAIIYFIILLLGRVSMYSVISFMLMFLICMALGYGYPLLTVMLSVFIVTKFLYDIAWFVGSKFL